MSSERRNWAQWLAANSGTITAVNGDTAWSAEAKKAAERDAKTTAERRGGQHRRRK